MQTPLAALQLSFQNRYAPIAGKKYSLDLIADRTRFIMLIDVHHQK